VVVPTLASTEAPIMERAAAAILESRLGGGSRRSAYFPGNVRFVSDYETTSIVVRRPDWQAAAEAGIPVERLVSWLAQRGRRAVYTPDSMVVASPPPLFRAHLADTSRHAVSRGRAARCSRGTSLSAETLFSLAPAACAVLGVSLGLAGRRRGASLVAVYGTAVVGAAVLAGLRFRSAKVGLLAAPGLAATQATYVVGFTRGVACAGSRRTRRRQAYPRRSAGHRRRG
jgi:hypothetical protein